MQFFCLSEDGVLELDLFDCLNQTCKIGELELAAYFIYESNSIFYLVIILLIHFLGFYLVNNY